MMFSADQNKSISHSFKTSMTLCVAANGGCTLTLSGTQ